MISTAAPFGRAGPEHRHARAADVGAGCGRYRRDRCCARAPASAGGGAGMPGAPSGQRSIVSSDRARRRRPAPAPRLRAPASASGERREQQRSRRSILIAAPPRARRASPRDWSCRRRRGRHCRRRGPGSKPCARSQASGMPSPSRSGSGAAGGEHRASRRPPPGCRYGGRTGRARSATTRASAASRGQAPAPAEHALIGRRRRIGGDRRDLGRLRRADSRSGTVPVDQRPGIGGDGAVHAVAGEPGAGQPVALAKGERALAVRPGEIGIVDEGVADQRSPRPHCSRRSRRPNCRRGWSGTPSAALPDRASGPA